MTLSPKCKTSPDRQEAQQNAAPCLRLAASGVTSRPSRSDWTATRSKSTSTHRRADFSSKYLTLTISPMWTARKNRNLTGTTTVYTGTWTDCGCSLAGGATAISNRWWGKSSGSDSVFATRICTLFKSSRKIKPPPCAESDASYRGWESRE